MLVKQLHSFRANQSFDTKKRWESYGVSVKEDVRKQSDGSTKTFFTRPDVEVEVELPDLEVLMATDEGKAVLLTMLEQLATNVMRPFVEENKNVEDYPDLTDVKELAKALVEKEKPAKLTATADQMKTGADLYLQYLVDGLKRDSKVAKAQADLFKAKFSTPRLDKFFASLTTRGVALDEAMGFINKLRDNVTTFIEFLDSQDEEIQEAGMLPALVCMQAIDKWLEGDAQEDEEDLVSLDAF